MGKGQRTASEGKLSATGTQPKKVALPPNTPFPLILVQMPGLTNLGNTCFFNSILQVQPPPPPPPHTHIHTSHCPPISHTLRLSHRSTSSPSCLKTPCALRRTRRRASSQRSSRLCLRLHSAEMQSLYVHGSTTVFFCLFTLFCLSDDVFCFCCVIDDVLCLGVCSQAAVD